ncbi:MAG TPA: multifunctional response regulator receiver/nitrate/sulfonate/bicarbonate ABC transporter substrate-binding protein, partial [Desulfobacteraceae bacterium]|nr:multifunctional response regulator receiver/nitrate/sulfonate/bicarbonate ABC transporter substrate-binding protein [Desulfobacteraceae bacterium]
ATVGVNFLDPEGKLGLNPEVLKKVFSQPQAIHWNNLYPDIEKLDTIQRYMHDVMEIGKTIDLEKFVHLDFANEACRG